MGSYKIEHGSTDKIMENRYHKLTSEYKQLYKQVTAILLKYDPIGIFFDENIDEYDPEVFTILPNLRGCKSEEDILQLLFQTFEQWFCKSMIGPKIKYKPIAKDIWEQMRAPKSKN